METFGDEATLGRDLPDGEVGSRLSLRHMPTEGTEIVCKARRWRQKVQVLFPCLFPGLARLFSFLFLRITQFFSLGVEDERLV